MSEARIKRIQDIVIRARAVHGDLIKEFTEGGIFDPVQAPLLKSGIEKFEGFFMEIEDSKSIDEMEKIINKHFVSNGK